jgi:hypothetical protein
MSATAVARIKAKLDAKFEGNRPAKSWTLAVLGGAIVISMTTAFGLTIDATGKGEADHPLFALLRLSAPVAIMVAYALDGSRYAKRDKAQAPLLYTIRIGQLADSLYFLGFLWTLWALIDCFVIHEMSIAQAVFRAFGYALVTTASGMFLRLLLLQFRYGDGASDQQEYVERQIAVFTRELGGAVGVIREFQKQSDEALKAWIGLLTASCNTVKENVKAIQDQTASLRDELVKVYEAGVEHNGKVVQAAVDEFNKRVEPNLKRLNEANGQLATSVVTGTRQIAQILNLGAEQLKGALDRNHDIITTATEAFVQGSADQMGHVEDALAGIAKRLSEIPVPQDAIERALIRQGALATSGLSEATSRLEDATRHLTTAAENSAKQIRSPGDRGSKAWWGRFRGE